MKEEQDYLKDLAEIRSMMERSSKFLSLSGLAGVMAGMYAIAGAWVAYHYFAFNPDAIFYVVSDSDLPKIVGMAVAVLVMAVGTAIILSGKNASKKGVKSWNSTSRQLMIQMAIPLSAGGILMLMLLQNGLIGLLAPLSLIFYGLALYNAGKFTYKEISSLGLIQIVLGLLSVWFIEFSLIIWAAGFGLVHIIYGIFMHFNYERN